MQQAWSPSGLYMLEAHLSDPAAVSPAGSTETLFFRLTVFAAVNQQDDAHQRFWDTKEGEKASLATGCVFKHCGRQLHALQWGEHLSCILHCLSFMSSLFVCRSCLQQVLRLLKKLGNTPHQHLIHWHAKSAADARFL